MDYLELYKKYKNIKPEVVEIIKRFQILREAGKTDSEIEIIIKEMKLPLGLHLYITGHFNNLMSLNLTRCGI